MKDMRFDTTGLVLHVHKPKTDQLRYGYFQPQIRTYDGTQSGVWYKKLGYSTDLKTPRPLYKALIGRDPADYGKHSGRRGGATAALEAGVSWLDLKHHGRWASDSAPQRYIKQTAKRDNTVAAALASTGRNDGTDVSSGRDKGTRQTTYGYASTQHSGPASKKICIWNEAQQ